MGGDSGGDAGGDVGGDAEVMEVMLGVTLMLLLEASLVMLVLICR